MNFSETPLLNISLGDYDRILEGLITALDATYAESAPKFKKAVEEWGKATAAKSKQNLNRPKWLLSSALSQIVRKYDKSGKIWALAGVTKDGKGLNAPSRYVRYHESGWRPKARGAKWGYDKKLDLVIKPRRYTPAAPPHFMRKAKEATSPLLKANLEAINKGIARTFERELAELNSRRREDKRLSSKAYRKTETYQQSKAARKARLKALGAK